MRSYIACLGALMSILAAHAPTHAQANIACLLSCYREHACAVKVPEVPEPKTLSGDTYTFEKSCNAAIVGSGKVLVRYRHNGAWFSPPELPEVNASLQAVFKKHPPDTCSVPTSSCLQNRMNGKTAGIAGHGVDGQQSSPGGAGEPCRRGLPCGLVLPPQGAWQFRLNEPFNGQWQIRLLRGEPRPGGAREWIAPVAGGVVAADGQQFDAGRVYAYRLIDRSRATVASGEFEILGSKRLEILQRLAQSRVAEGMSERAAWIDTMFNAELDWDAFRVVGGN